MKKEILGKCMLLMSALIWGSSFIVMKNAVDFISPFTLLCIRFVLSTIFIHSIRQRFRDSRFIDSPSGADHSS